MTLPPLKYRVPRDLAEVIQAAAPGGKNALFRWHLRFAAQQVLEWLANDRIMVGCQNTEQRTAVKAVQDWLRTELEENTDG